MKRTILGFTFGKDEPIEISNTNQDNYYNFSAPFLNVGKGNLALPYVQTGYRGVGGYIRFGDDNLYPSLLRQLKHTSPLHGSIIKFINNATVGGGYSIDNLADNAQAKVDMYKFENRINLKKFIKSITNDALMFESINLLVENDANGIAKSIKRIPMDELRWDEMENKFTYCKDFSRNIGIVHYNKYKINEPNNIGIISIRFDDGDMIYPIPNYASANNWIFLDGELSYLHKSNILNSVFASTVFKFPKKPSSDAEAMAYKKTIESAKGASEAGKSIAFFENGVDNLPIIETLPTSNNDKLFLQTDERTDSKICQAWSIDPMLMGIRVSGKLGSGTDIQQSYTIFEKNVVMPLRDEIEDIINLIMDISGIKGEFSLNNYQIINNEITEQK